MGWLTRKRAPFRDSLATLRISREVALADYRAALTGNRALVPILHRALTDTTHRLMRAEMERDNAPR